jgi:hypothetical protein
MMVEVGVSYKEWVVVDIPTYKILFKGSLKECISKNKLGNIMTFNYYEQIIEERKQ